MTAFQITRYQSDWVADFLLAWHELTGLSSMCTVHVRHCTMPQPNIVPVNRRMARNPKAAACRAQHQTISVRR
jgi:hypothetical protein